MSISRKTRIEVFRLFYERNEGMKNLEQECPKHYYAGVVFCEDFCEAIPTLMEDNPSPTTVGVDHPVCPCFAFGCEEAMERLRKYLAMEDAI